MGSVYLAKHSLLDKEKVVKVLLPEYADNPELRARFEREAKAVAKLKHDRIISVDDLATLPNGQLYQMMERLDGKPLNDFLRSYGGKVGQHRALEILAQLCDALAYLHSMGIVHRDLKTENVFVHDRDVKLLDFGIAKDNIDPGPTKTKTGVVIGTPRYMSPEQFSNAGRATHLSDLYSLAVIGWEMVTGDLPFKAENLWGLLLQQNNEVPYPQPQSGMPEKWLPILQKQLHPDPGYRFQSARAFLMALAKATPPEGKKLSGEEIIWKFAPKFLEHADPQAETARGAEEAERMWALMPVRTVQLPVMPEPEDVGLQLGPTLTGAATTPRPPGSMFASAAISSVAPQPPSSMFAGAAASVAPQLPSSTLAGAAVASRHARLNASRRWKLGAIVGGCAALVTTVLVLVGSTTDDGTTRPGVHGHDARPPERLEPSSLANPAQSDSSLSSFREALFGSPSTPAAPPIDAQDAQAPAPVAASPLTAPPQQKLRGGPSQQRPLKQRANTTTRRGQAAPERKVDPNAIAGD